MTAAKKAEAVLFDIVRDIAEGGLRPGDRLPSQAEMTRRYGASLTPLREALRMLELCGLLSVRPGPSSRAVLEAAGAEQLAQLVAPFLCVASVTYGQLLEAWAATEGLLAEAAAANPDRDAVGAELSRFVTADAHGDEPVPPAAAVDFHDAVARAAGNPALALVLEVLAYVVADFYWASTQLPASGRRVRRGHREIAEAILAGDKQCARRCVEQYAQLMSDEILSRIGKRADEPFVWAKRPAGLAVYRRRPQPGQAVA